ncbi:MAG: EamA family transporter RarD [Enterobacteriaceae bacterium]|jgi:chloramphenicol-sensitive protein RarD|nr:EamA family transporter RarD [Enterobacteriaceae bacterium]
MDSQQTRQGVLFALAAYFIWGIAPAYFKFIANVPADEILTHRIIWSFFFMLLLITVGKQWKFVAKACQNKTNVLLLSVSAVLIGSNWLTFIWAVNNQHLLEASMGYFINPLVTVLLGMIFLGERFRPMQWVAVMLAFAGIMIQLWQFGSIPYISLILAFTFGLYALMRKKIGVDSQTGMLIETLWLLPLAIVYLFFIADTPTSHLSQNSMSLNLLLAAAGVVTTIPLLFFTAAATKLRLSTLGFFQYLGPTLMFILAVVIYDETIGTDMLMTFGFIWAALVIFILDALYYQRKLR